MNCTLLKNILSLLILAKYGLCTSKDNDDEQASENDHAGNPQIFDPVDKHRLGRRLEYHLLP